MTPQEQLKPQEPDIDLSDAIEQLRIKKGIPKQLVDRLVNQESGGSESATSPKGARGSFQVMPATFDQYNRKVGGKLDPNNPLDRAYVGMSLLQDNYNQFKNYAKNDQHNWGMAVAGYHAGPNNVMRDLRRGGNGIPDTNDGLINTRDYVYNIMSGIKPEESQSDSPTTNAQEPLSTKVETGITGEPPKLKTPKVTSTVTALDELPAVNPVDFTPGKAMPRKAGPTEFVASMFDEAPKGTVEEELTQNRYKTPPSTELATAVKIPFSPHLNPSADDVERGYLASLGPGYAKYGEKYKAETGRNILSLGAGDLDRDPDGSIYVKPTRAAIDVLNAYVKSGGDLNAAKAEGARIAGERRGASTLAEQQAAPDIAAVRAGRIGLGTLPAAQRAVESPLISYGGAKLAQLGGLISGFGIVPNQASDYLKTRGKIMELGAGHAPLTPAGEAIQRSVPEKVATGLTHLGLGVADILLLKKGTGLSTGQIMALESLAHDTDLPPGQRAMNATQAYAMGKILDSHLDRATSGAIFAVPTAVEGSQQVARGEKSKTDVLLDTLIQGGTGAILGGKGREEPKLSEVQANETLGIGRAPVVPDIERTLADREAKVQPSFLRDDQGNPVARVLNPEEVAQGEKPKIRPIHHSDTQIRDDAGKFTEAPAESQPAERTPLQTSTEAPQQPTTVEPVKRGDMESAANDFIRDVKAEATPEQPTPENLPALQKYAQSVIDDNQGIKEVRLIGSTAAKGKGNDIDVLYDLGDTKLPKDEGDAVEKIIEILEKHDHLDAGTTHDIFIKAGDRYFYRATGAGPDIIENSEYGREQDGKPSIVLAKSPEQPNTVVPAVPKQLSPYESRVPELDLVLQQLRDREYGLERRDERAEQLGVVEERIQTAPEDELEVLIPSLEAMHSQTKADYESLPDGPKKEDAWQKSLQLQRLITDATVEKVTQANARRGADITRTLNEMATRGADKARVPRRSLPEPEFVAPKQIIVVPQTPVEIKTPAAPSEGGVSVPPGKPFPTLSTGNESKATTERGTEVSTKYAIVEAANLVSSHDNLLNRNPDFPEELQPRDRGRAASEVQIQKIEKNPRGGLLAESPKASDGAPIVGPDGIVESGNARTIGLRRAYEKGNADRYRQYLLDNAEKLGLDPKSIQDAKEPILVRLRTSDVNREQFAREANESSLAAMSAPEQAKSDGKQLTSDLLATFAPSESGEINTTANTPFIRNFMRDVVGPNDLNRYVSSDGAVSQEGLARIRNAIFARAYGDSPEGLRALEKIAESPDNNVRNITNALLQRAGQFASLKDAIAKGDRFPLDLTSDLTKALGKLSSLREESTSIADYLNQRTLFEEDLTPLQKQALKMFDEYKRSTKAISFVLDNYAKAVEAIGDPKQQTMFGGEVPSRESVFDAAMKETIDDAQRQSALFSSKRVQPESGTRSENPPTTGAAQAPTPGEAAAPKEPAFVRAARERATQRAAEKQQGIEYRRAGADPYELIDSLIVKGWELYDQKIKPTFEEWSRKLREEFGPKAEEHLRGVWAKVSNEQPSEESSTAAMKAKVDEDRAARGAEPLPWKPETKADEDLLSEANRRALANPREAQQLTAEVLKKPRALSDVETVQLDVHKQELVNDHNQILKEIAETDDPEKLTAQSARLDAIEQEFDDTDRAWRASGTEKGRSLRAQRITINQNYELLPMKARMKAATGEVKLPPEVEAKIEAQQKRIAELEARWNKRVAAKEEKARTESVDKAIIERKIEIRRAGRRRSRQALVAERADLKQQVAQAWAKMKPKSSTLSMGGLGDIDPEGELSRALGNLARNYIEDGVVKAADLVDVIHEQIKDVADLTKRQVSDLISGYGKTREPTVDPIETKLNEVKSILASTSGTADVLEKGVRPLRRGQQREKPTEDQRRALRELEDAMREKGPELAQQPYDVKTEQATPLDKAKTTARNRQEQLQKWIADGKREVQGRQQVIPDAELNRLKAENAALDKVVALLDDPAADQKAIERRMVELQKMISRQRSDIQAGKVSPGVKEGAKSTWSPEIGAMEKERRALMGIANDMRADAARKAKAAEAAKPTGVYGVEGSWADFEARAKKALAARKKFENRIADMQRQRAAGNFEKKPKAEPLVHDPDTERLRLEMNREKRKFDADVFNAKIKKEWSERPAWSKGMAYGAGFVRAGVLSGVKTLGKIESALAQRTAQQYGEEGAARLAKPFVRGTAEKATRYGGHMNVESEKAAAKGFVAGIKEIPNIIRTGESELSRRFSDRYPGIPTKLGRALEVPGRFHFAEKNPLMRGEFERYKELALQEAERKTPGARNNPAVIDAIEERAYKSAKEVILMGDNPFSRMITDAQRRLSLAQKDMVRTIVPVHRVAGNYLNQAINEYGLGIFRGAIRAIHERNPDALAKLTPEEADKTMRLIQRGTLGVIYMALAGTPVGGALGVKFGGFYKRGRKDEVKPQDVKIGGVTIPHWALHSPPDELAQLTASMKQEWDEGRQREETRGQRFASGAARSVKGVMGQTPFVNELTQITNSLDSGDSLSGWAGRFVASRVEPQIVQEIARTTDKYQGQDVKRKPRGFTDALKMGLPGARQTVPISPVFGSQASKASNEVQRLDMALNGVTKKPDESRQEFAERQPLVDGYIRRALEKEVTKSDYQNDSDPNKIERLKQVKAAAEKEGQAAYDATPRPQKFKKQKQVYPVPSGAPQSQLRSPWLPPRNPFKTGSETFKA